MSTIQPDEIADLAVLRGMTHRLREPSHHPFRRLCLQLAEVLELECEEEYRPQVRHIAAALREAWELRCNACGQVYGWPRYDHSPAAIERISRFDGDRYPPAPAHHRRGGDCPACAR